MAQITSSYNPNRYIMSQNHQQQHGPQQQSGYYCSNQQQQHQHQQQQRHQQQHVSLSRQQHSYMMGCFAQNSSGWAGIPLISTAARRPRKSNFSNNANNNNNSNNVSVNPKHRLLVSNNSSEFDENAMSRLAIHAHGAPLILTGRYRNRTQKRDGAKQSTNGTFLAKKTVENSNQTTALNTTNDSNNPSKTGASADCISVTSDESSSTNGTTTETCLPRIIKPRKRRKKDRKPQPNVCGMAESMLQGNTIINHDNISHLVTHEMPLNSRELFNSMENPYNSSSSNQNVCTEYPQQQQDTSDNLFQIQSEDEPIATCCCRICDPSCRIWAFPLRRSCSDNTAELEMQRSKDVGVIGSNRSASSRSEWRGSSTIDSSNRSLFRNGSFSDSGDSGCDLLSGINFGEDLFYNGQSNPISSSPSDDIDHRSFIDFPAAESLLTESINEISKKLMETVDLRSDIFSSDSSSVFSDSVFSDDVLNNIESFAQNYNNIHHHNNNTGTSYYCTTSDLVNVHNHNQLISNNNNNNNGNNNSNIKMNGNYLFSGGDNCNFVMFHEKDCENEILNCFDMVWSDGGGGVGGGDGVGRDNFKNHLSPIEEQRIQLQSTG